MILMMPVAGLISTSARWVPLGNVPSAAGKVALAFNFEGSTPGRLARSAKLTERSVPAIRTLPSLLSRSPGLGSRPSGADPPQVLAEFAGRALDADAAGRN